MPLPHKGYTTSQKTTLLQNTSKRLHCLKKTSLHHLKNTTLLLSHTSKYIQNVSPHTGAVMTLKSRAFMEYETCSKSLDTKMFTRSSIYTMTTVSRVDLWVSCVDGHHTVHISSIFKLRYGALMPCLSWRRRERWWVTEGPVSQKNISAWYLTRTFLLNGQLLFYLFFWKKLVWCFAFVVCMWRFSTALFSLTFRFTFFSGLKSACLPWPSRGRRWREVLLSFLCV